MSLEWPSVSISDIAGDWKGSMAVGPFGSRMKADLYVPSGVRVIRGNNLSGGREPEGDYVHVSEETADSLASCCLKPGDLVFPHRGNIGEVGITPDDGLRYMLSTSLMKLSPDREKAEPLYLMYFFKSAIGRAALLMNASQVGTPGIATPLRSLRGIQLPLPPLMIQRQIVDTLSKLDDRINLLRETNATLEAIAQALFKSWFVDFDPVRAKMEGRSPEGMDEATAALFPDGFEESELGLVPRGWKVKFFGDFIARQSVGEKYDQKSALPEGIVPILDQGKSGIIGFHSNEPGVKASLGDPVVVFANHTCYMRLITFDFSAIQNVLPFTGKDVDTVWAFYATKKRIAFSEYKGHWPDFVIEKAVVPPSPVTHAFRSTVNSFIRCMRNNEIQAETLATLRDTLLPRLISGQLRLPDADIEPQPVELPA